MLSDVTMHDKEHYSVAEPDLDIWTGGGECFACLFASFLSSLISFLPKMKRGDPWYPSLEAIIDYCPCRYANKPITGEINKESINH